MQPEPIARHDYDRRFSIVTPVYNVDRYLDRFIASVDAQTMAVDEFEVVAVDDGSTDGSLAILQAWAARAAYRVVVLTKENGGVSTARNLGLEHARGEWVTFSDPDDELNPPYLQRISTFIAGHPTSELIAGNVMVLHDSTGEVVDSHPLRERFKGRARLRDLDLHPGHFFVSANAAFFRRTRIDAQGLRFDPAVRPTFEDGHFAGRYLLALPRPLVGFVPGAHYRYRQRTDASSMLGASVTDPGRYTTVPELGYLGLLKCAKLDRDGEIPFWLQNLVLYELSWLIRIQSKSVASSSAAVSGAGERFHQLLEEIVGYLDPEAIDGSPVTSLSRVWRDVLLNSWSGRTWHTDVVQLTRHDRAQRLVRMTYRYVGAAPQEVVLSGGRAIDPVHAKVRDIELLGRVLMHERIIWVPSTRALRLRLDGVLQRFALEPPPRPRYAISPVLIRESLDRSSLRRDKRAKPSRPPGGATTLAGRALLRLAGSKPVRRRYADAWVLMDRIRDAGDNAQRLFEHLRAERPEINAWFVLSRDSAEWAELRRVHGRRIVAHGSHRWKLLLLNAAHLLSSHVDHAVVEPRELVVELGVRPSWRFTFLQHGVIKDDLSNWLNPKPIDLFVTSTPAELESVVGDHSRYGYTTREVKLTGMPRFDRLRSIGEQIAPSDRDLVLVAPTWRNWLVPPPTRGRARSVVPDFGDSEFVRTWLALLADPRITAAAADLGLTIGFLPHPDLQAALVGVPLPEGVRLLTFVDNDVQELFARAAVVVTDYSSMAVNAAYIERPLVYYQFDQERVRAGEHLGTRGYFDYDRDGYGPVVLDHDAAVAAIIQAARAREPEPQYRDRIREAFPSRDGRCCERVVDAVIASTTKAELR